MSAQPWEIRNCILPHGKVGSIYIENGLIVRVGALPTLPRYLDAEGSLFAVPGSVNMHVHFRNPGHPHKATPETESRAALVGGCTTIGDMPNTDPWTDTHERLAQKEALFAEVPVDARFWMAGVSGNCSEIISACKSRRVFGVKCYYEPSTGGLVVCKYKDRIAIALAAKESGKINAVHAGDEEITQRVKKEILRTRPLQTQDHCQIYSAESELAGVKQALAVQRETGVKMLLCHISTPAALREILKAKQAGRSVFIEVCPHHLFLTAELLARSDGNFFQMIPALRSPGEVEQMMYHLLAGDVDIISSDHAPHTAEEKSQPYPNSPSGIPGVQELFSLMYSLVACGKMTMQRFIDLTSRNAAKLSGLKKGEIAPGFDADIVLFDPNQEVVWAKEELWSKCGWSAFALAGVNGMGTPEIVIVGGEIMYTLL